MRLLLDTCTFLWYSVASDRLSPSAREALTDSENDLYLSAVSVWEISVKYGLKRLSLSSHPAIYVPENRRAGGITSLDLKEEIALHAADLPRHHNDPFDRMLVCQAMLHGLTILSPDPLLAQYDVRILW